MSSETKKPFGIYLIGIVGAIAIGYGTIRIATKQVAAPEITAQRTAERLKFRQEVTDATTVTLTNGAVIDPQRGIYRLPINAAVDLTIREWQNPAAARKTLLDRLETATAKLPEKPNAFE